MTTFYAQHGEDQIMTQAMGNTDGPRYFVEVGVIDGIRFSNTLALEQRGWRGLCVEAHPGFIERVRKHRPGSQVIHAAVSDQNGGSLTFYADPRGDLSTLTVRSDDEMKKRFGHWFQGFEKVEVPARTLNDILQEAQAPRGFELLSIDIEGGESAALRGLDLEQWQPRLILLEADDPKQRDFYESYLGEAGYHLARMVGINALYARRMDDIWRIRLARVQQMTTHTANPMDAQAADRVVHPYAFETRGQYAQRLMHELPRTMMQVMSRPTGRMLLPLKKMYWHALTLMNRQPACTVINPHPWMEALARHAPKHETMIIVDGGAFDGRTSLQFLQRFPNSQVHAFEPIAESRELCENNLRNVSATVHPQALSAQTGSVTMHINSEKMACSALPAGAEADRFNSAMKLEACRVVPSVRLDDWAQRLGIERIDILKLDLQGYELEALRGAEKLLARGIACIYLEVNFTAAYEGAPTLTDIDLFLRERGYRIHNFYNQHSWTRDGQLSGGDVLFVRQKETMKKVTLRAA